MRAGHDLNASTEFDARFEPAHDDVASRDFTHLAAEAQKGKAVAMWSKRARKFAETVWRLLRYLIAGNWYVRF
jgi:hypothetical protein